MDKLTVGTVIEVGALMGNLSKERVVIMITTTTTDKVEAQATYYGVVIGDVVGTKNEDGSVKWTFL